ncbi:TetR family transcriptional regulator [Nocardia otitidiscaviarum]|uniref:QsdR family transcriptional regulator n=1 Tax=Nocardia otitidiscaviarum TaxID=1823 RepID=UPI0004A726A5|nr:QsdR family transcriptional regulator [Nocardia otitidiscaviarum]MBF6133358.1 TetR family transcriptional regulator [Nocardia otitidiscaviarum]MBF6486754.1 TetR family transcriptional regulator [Nocardia otitidiscaviarum]
MSTRQQPARSPGRPASATKAEVVELARRAFLAGERVDVQAVAAELGLSRASIYRWFGSRDGLMGAVLADEFESLLRLADGRRKTTGAHRILEALDRTNHWLAASAPLQRYLDNERLVGLKVLTASDGPVQPKAVAAVEDLITRTEDEDGYHAILDRQLLAYTLIRLLEAFLYNDTAAGIRGDVDRLRQVQAALLGIPE